LDRITGRVRGLIGVAEETAGVGPATVAVSEHAAPRERYPVDGAESLEAPILHAAPRKRSRSNLVNVATAARALGVDVRSVLELVACGDVAASENKRDFRVSRRSIDDVLAVFRQRVAILPTCTAAETLDWRSATRSGARVPSSALLQAVREGSVRVFEIDRDAIGVRGLRFSSVDLESCGLKPASIGTDRTCELLRCQGGDPARLLSVGFISLVPGRSWPEDRRVALIDSASVERFDRRYASTAKLSHQFGQPVTAIQEAMDAGGIRPFLPEEHRAAAFWIRTEAAKVLEMMAAGATGRSRRLSPRASLVSGKTSVGLIPDVPTGWARPT